MEIKMFAGDSKKLEFTVRDPDCEIVALGSPQSIRWQMANGPDQPAVLSKSVGNGIAIVDQAAGRFDVTLDPADTETKAGSFYYEAEIVFADGKVATVDSGRIRITATLIKPA